METETWTKEQLISIWLEIGSRNTFLRECIFEDGKPWGEHYFYECKSIEELHEKFSHGNWILGQTFHFENLCFVNLQEGGSEFAVYRDDIDFETITGHLYSLERLQDDISKWKKATPDQLRNLDFPE